MTTKYLLIGGCGFIGSHLARALVHSGKTVTSLDRNDVLGDRKVDGVRYVSGDYGDKSLIETLLAEHDEVIHLAYATRPNTSFDDPLADLLQNLSPAVQLFELSAKYSVRLILISSGGTVYGEALSTPILESHPTWPISPYGVTKLTLEKYANLFAVTKGLDVICIRPANPYGKGQLPFIGQGFVAAALALALKGKPITIFGKQGTVRDYIYIADLITGITTVLNKGYTHEVYNIGTGTGLSNLDVVNEIQSLFESSNINVQYENERPFDVKVNILNAEKLQCLGWEPKISINDGLKKTLSWLQEYMKYD